jgi:hypothetical protein
MGRRMQPRSEKFLTLSVATECFLTRSRFGPPAHGLLFVTGRRTRQPRRADLTPEGDARLSYRRADTLWKRYAPGWTLHQLRHTAISARAAKGYTVVELKRFSGHTSLRSLEQYIAHNREAAKRKAREWEPVARAAPARGARPGPDARLPHLQGDDLSLPRTRRRWAGGGLHAMPTSCAS